MGIAWGLSQRSPSFAQRDAELRARGMAPIQARVALARHACRLAYRLLRNPATLPRQRLTRCVKTAHEVERTCRANRKVRVKPAGRVVRVTSTAPPGVTT